MLEERRNGRQKRYIERERERERVKSRLQRRVLQEPLKKLGTSAHTRHLAALTELLVETIAPKSRLSFHPLVEGESNELNFLHQFSLRQPTKRFLIVERDFCSDKKTFVRFEVFTAVSMKKVVFWDVALCRSWVNRRFGGTYRFHLQGRKIRERGTYVSRCL
jgi:hypothetical protein